MSTSVLLADDHAIVRDGLKFILEADSNITVCGTAPDGREAVRLARSLNPDVVIMDISMPNLNGIDAAGQILELCPSSRIIILSMHHTSEHIYRALRAGVSGYLLKESAGQEVLEAVRTVLRGNRYLSRKIEETVIDGYVQQSDEAFRESPLERLTSREREILHLVVEGRSSAQIADMIFISPKTVETYRSRLMKKLEVSDVTALVKFAIQHGITTLDT